MKQILNGWESIKSMERGAEKLCNCVKLTLGPKGKNVAIERKYTFPLITNDGVTIAKEVELSDRFENMGAQVIKEASIRTNDVAGDGTTTACVLAHAMISQGIRNYTAGANPVILKRGMQKATACAVQALKEMSVPVRTSKEIFQIASVSAGSEEIGALIAEAFDKVGKEGVITVDEGKTLRTELKVVEGMQFDRGYLSPYMCTNMDKMTATLNNPLILITDAKISNINEILHLLEPLSSSGRALLIIADDIENEVLSTLVLNKLRGMLNVVCVKAPAYGDRRTATLMDICALTGATLISNEVGKPLNQATEQDLGSATSVVVTKDTTTITGGKGGEQDVIDRINTIKAQLTDDLSDFDRDKLQERLAKLTGGVAVIVVGSATEIEMQEQKLRIEDAISATKSAVAEGIVAGGGTALISTLPAIDKLIEQLSGDEKTGAQIVRTALTLPLITIANNAGVDGSVVLNNVLAGNTLNTAYGYDALNDKYVDMLQAGIIDPTKVTRSALENASSVASTLLTTECLICDDNDNK